MRIFKWIGASVALFAALVLFAGQLGLFQGTQPDDLGVRDGRLKPPSKTANSVSSQARLWPDHPQRETAWIAPLALRGDGPATMTRLKALLQAQPGVSIVESRADYLYAQYTTRLMKFVDDAEFWFDPAHGVIQVRSSSRVGRHDFGVNRQRIEALRERLATS
ncbi:MAG: DUF1499 domain-containing protein [Candidatus Accumulibacter sp.]|uniref:DUF1499 domain-containing protein n=1 Tax=Candidatus Accumulibacter proximus TaxID=2954385 RepID=A0A935UHF6_9PROT|nr:DUF1499 domain-containing protein [Candidatus Accumulibacter proximus]